MNCIICGNIISNNKCNKCGHIIYKKGIFRQAKKHKKNNMVIDKINEFFIYYENLKRLNFYINKKYYLKTLETHEKNYKKIKLLKDANILSTYSKNNEYHIENLERFLNLYESFHEYIDQLNDEFVENRLAIEKDYLDNILKVVDPIIKLDDDQRRAIITDEDYNLIIAGAGAGKTTTIAAKVKYLVDKEGISEKEIMVVSFTNKAVKELKEKISALNIEPIISTFHSIGNSIIAKENTNISKILHNKYWLISKYLKETLLDDVETLKKLIVFFGYYLNVPLELLEFNSLEQYYSQLERMDYSTLKSNLNEYNKKVLNIKSKKQISINSEFLRSIQEVQIANFLYIHNVDYIYEKPYKYKIKGMRRRYIPDFYITQDGKEFYIEHFGISERGENDRYSDIELKNYLRSIEDKKNLHYQKGTNLISTYSSYNDGRDLIVHLKEELEKQGIRLEKKSDEEIFKKILSLDKDKYFYKFTQLSARFLGLFKAKGYTEKNFSLLRRKTKSPRSILFLDVMERVYLFYQSYLKKEGAVDFEDMINESVNILQNKDNIRYDFKYIIVDEYQDISQQRHNLVYELSKITDAKIVAVGDDWQSIFAFAGSDISLFTSFCDLFGYGKELKITKTYRNAQEVIDVAGSFIQKNSNQIKKKLISNKNIKQPIVIYTYDNSFKKSKTLEFKAKNVNDTIMRILRVNKRTKKNKKHNILLIGRYGFDGEQLGKTTYFNYNYKTKKISSIKFPEVDLTFLTVHSSKGLGYDDVIILNAENSLYGFPSQLEDDPILKLVSVKEESFHDAEERRLFYVALTRTKNRVFIITPNTNPSKFILELINDYDNVKVVGSINTKINSIRKIRQTCPVCGYPVQLRKSSYYGINVFVCMNEPELCSFVTNDMNGDERGIHSCEKCDGYMIVRRNKKTNSFFYGCSNFIDTKRGCQETSDINLRS